MATLWKYEGGNGWYAHIDFGDYTSPRMGPFGSEAEAAVVCCRKNGIEPPEDCLSEFNAKVCD